MRLWITAASRVLDAQKQWHETCESFQRLRMKDAISQSQMKEWLSSIEEDDRKVTLDAENPARITGSIQTCLSSFAKRKICFCLSVCHPSRSGGSASALALAFLPLSFYLSSREQGPTDRSWSIG